MDTGAEINVINSRLIPDDCVEPLPRPWNLTAANQERIIGGDKQAHMVLRLKGTDVDTGKPQGLKIPTTFLLANVGHLDAQVS